MHAPWTETENNENNSVSRGPQGISPQLPGVLVGPPHVRKCHQMSSKEHIQLGWVVRWVLSTPPGHPTAGRCVRAVPVLPLLLCTRPARARPSIGGQSPTPAPRQLPWSPPRAWRPRRLAALQFSRFARRDSCLSFRAVCAKLETHNSQPAHASPNCFLVRSSGLISSHKVTLLLQVQRRPEVLCWGGWFLF
jgi:hypothetical protein